MNYELLNRTICTVIMVVMCVVDVHAQAQEAGVRTLIIEPAASDRVELHVAKTGLYRGKVHVFLFPKYNGTLQYNATHPEASQIRLNLSAASIKLTDTWLGEKDFKEVQRYALEDMLDAKKFPEITFVSAHVQVTNANHFVVRGTLTIRGVAKPATVYVTLQSSAGGLLNFEGEATVKLTDFGLKPPTAALGLIGTKDEMTLSFVLNAK
ncbi:MAG: YceI family protein [Acidobacteriota bacterium]